MEKRLDFTQNAVGRFIRVRPYDSLCASGVRQYFGVGDAEKMTVVISNKKPRGTDYYELGYVSDREGDDDYSHYQIVDMHEDLCTSPWDIALDRYVIRAFGRNKTLYVWAEV